MIIGIDLGTTNSLVAALVDGQPAVLPNALGSKMTPSAISILDDDSLVLGHAATQRLITHPERSVAEFKRDIGTARTYPVANRTYSPQELSSLVLLSLKQDAEMCLGVPVTEAVITVPAYFGEAQRAATRDAARIAGLNVERLINEPTAAALAYGMDHEDVELRAVVLDLGGGTFDVTVLEILEGVIEIQSSAGDSRLGGLDFTRLVATELVPQIARSVRTYQEDASTWARIIAACERAKRDLTEGEEAPIRLPGLLSGKETCDLEASISRAAFETASEPLLRRMTGIIHRALRDANLSPGDVDEILLVGGATRMPCVRRCAEDLFGRPVSTDLSPDEAVVRGAAIQAGLKQGARAVEDIVVTDVAPFSIGVSVSASMASRLVTDLFEPIIDRGTVIPCSRVERLMTLRDDQTTLLVEVYQGEHAVCRDNQKLGAYEIRGLPARPAGEVHIDVRLTYDLNGLLDVDMTTSDGQTHSLFINRGALAMSETDIAKARRSMQRLKFHPRQALPNVHALERAEALFLELTGEPRKLLQTALSGFRLQLESQDLTRIDQARARLLSLMSMLTNTRR